MPGIAGIVRRAQGNRRLLCILSIVCCGILVYSNTLENSFHLDDFPSIVDNLAVRNIGNPRLMWKFWPTRFLTYLSFAANYAAGRLDVRGYHLVNIALHLACCLCVWGLVVLVFRAPAMKDDALGRDSDVLAAVAGMVFAVHPVQTQAVTYIVQRATLLASLFCLLSLNCYMKARMAHSAYRWRGWYAASLTCGLAAMFSKEMAIVLPVLVLLCELFFFGAQCRTRRNLLVPFLALPAILGLVAFVTGSVQTAGMIRTGEMAPGISPLDYLLTQLRVVVTYMRLLLVPVNQSVDHDVPAFPALGYGQVLASGTALLFLAVLAFLRRRKDRLVVFGAAWFFVALLPESSVFPIRDVMVEHRLYLPVAGFAILLPGLLAAAFRRFSRIFLWALVAVILVSYGVAAWRRNTVWRDGICLWSDAAAKAPRKTRPLVCRARVYERMGMYRQALADYTKAAEMDANPSDIISDRGLARYSAGDATGAIADFDLAIRYDAGNAAAYGNRGLVYTRIGDFARAREDLLRAVQIRPDYMDAHCNLGLLLRRSGDEKGALEQFNTVLRLNGDHVPARYSRGLLFLAAGRLEDAVCDLTRALEINPSLPQAYFHRGTARNRLGEYRKAEADFTRAIRLDSAHALAYGNRAVARSNLGNLQGALKDYGEAIRLKPDFADAYYNRAIDLERTGNFAAAAEDFQKYLAFVRDPAEAAAIRKRIVRLKAGLY